MLRFWEFVENIQIPEGFIRISPTKTDGKRTPFCEKKIYKIVYLKYVVNFKNRNYSIFHLNNNSNSGK